MRANIPRWILTMAALVAASHGGPADAQTPEFAPRVVIPRAMPAIKDASVITATEADKLLDETSWSWGFPSKAAREPTRLTC